MKRLSLVLGLLTLALIWAGPLLSAWRESFAAHMLAHMGVVAIAAPLIAIGVSDRMRAVPPSLPLVASLVELLAVWGWHAPAARLWAETSLSVTVFEQTTVLAAGLFLWLTCIAPAGTPARDASGAMALLLTSVHMTLLGALLSLASRPLYGTGPATCFGFVLSPEQDQQVGGVVMLLLGAVAYLVGGLALFGSVMRGRPQTEVAR